LVAWIDRAWSPIGGLDNTNNSLVRDNRLTDNTTGIFVIVLPNLPTSSAETALIERNVVHKNNRPNPSSKTRSDSALQTTQW
jgi:hypothetical protein